jgi:uncharacterized protein (TIGR02611 family)
VQDAGAPLRRRIAGSLGDGGPRGAVSRYRGASTNGAAVAGTAERGDGRHDRRVVPPGLTPVPAGTPAAVPTGSARRRASTWLIAVRAARKVVVSAIGGLVVVVGVILLPLPGPGMLVIGLGLAILSTEYRWPHRLSRRLRHEAAALAERRRRRRADRQR